MKKTRALMLIAAAGLVIAATGAQADVPGQAIYADLLARHVDRGVVDYQGVKADEADLDRYLAYLADVNPQALSRDERFAFYVNAYNAWTIKLILTRYPKIDSIKDLGGLFSSPWKKKIARIDGQLLTLDQIEHDILRKDFRDPRVHVAVNCASKGCPPLQSEPFAGSRLNAQLDRAARAFVNDPRFNRLDGTVLWLSRIFDWFAEDFGDDVIDFILQYADSPLRDRLMQNRAAISVRYLDYDWSLNGR